MLEKWGFQHTCAVACLKLRKKLNASDQGIIAPLRLRVFYDIMDYEEIMCKRTGAMYIGG